jgi:hypothetical protein
VCVISLVLARSSSACTQCVSRSQLHFRAQAGRGCHSTPWPLHPSSAAPHTATGDPGPRPRQSHGLLHPHAIVFAARGAWRLEISKNLARPKRGVRPLPAAACRCRCSRHFAAAACRSFPWAPTPCHMSCVQKPDRGPMTRRDGLGPVWGGSNLSGFVYIGSYLLFPMATFRSPNKAPSRPNAGWTWVRKPPPPPRPPPSAGAGCWCGSTPCAAQANY